MQGTILKINVEVGDKVKKGDILVILEAMKMENEIKSRVAGRVKEIFVKTDASVTPDDFIMVIGK